MRLLAALLLLAAPASAQQVMPVAPAVVVRTFPHDPRAFTEGLLYHDGYLYEATGEPGRSSIRKVDLATGKVLQQVVIPPPTFEEGIAVWKDQIVSLTWHEKTGYRWTLPDFRKIGSFHYPGEGWSLTSDGPDLLMSDGTAQLRVIDPATFCEKRRITVTYQGRPLEQLNELEYVDGEILANIWQTNMIARIDPASGKVIGWIDVTGLTAQINPTNPDDVPNGIAWDARGRRLFVTGKDWPLIFQIELPPLPKAAG
jgi:glutaminyl-peptide cyclotransferase